MAKNTIALQSELSKAYETIDRLKGNIHELNKQLSYEKEVLIHTQNLLTKHLRRETHFTCFIEAMERETATLKFNLNTK